ncbi:hypothetical protein OSB04_025301 [Centaurea solstitialis]|uniref:Uncharacterized protein n=1 Tax=Centaurea solstitialis TaxID=347529 RepID=A0AA38SMV0_9ASTR|nr:hypothetical protein OSB04_025301 [Centaurea solstitialis]
MHNLCLNGFHKANHTEALVENTTIKEMSKKVDIFASPKQPSLFPMTIECPNISKEDYNIFYQHERRLFTFLIAFLHREIVESTLVLGFLIWLEREGYTSKNLVRTMVDSLSLSTISLVVDEVVACLKCIEKKGNKLLLEGSNMKYDISLLNNLLDRKRICLKEFHENRDSIFSEVSQIANDVYSNALKDILQQFIRGGTPLTTVPPKEVNTGIGSEGSRYLGHRFPFPSYEINNYLGFRPELGFTKHQDWPMASLERANAALLTPMLDFRQHKDLCLNSPLITRDLEYEIPADDRTVFLTFSKGYPISESEVKDYFTRNFGDFIEAIHMHDVGPDEQPLYARIVACSPSMVNTIVGRDGPEGKSKYNINGKHVWARKYVKKKPTRLSLTQSANSEITTPPQP